MNSSIFREYDIRGHAEKDLTSPFVTKLGRILGDYFQKNKTYQVVLGRDCRLHSLRICEALTKGLISSGMNVINIGVGSTPLLYFSVHHLQKDAGIQITGSHNPSSDNGFKLVHQGRPLYGSVLQTLCNDMQQSVSLLEQRKGVISFVSTQDAYVAFLQERLRMGKRRFRIVVDAGNGTGGILVPLLQSLGFEVIPLYCEMDGRFPHHHPDPTVPENLQDLISCVRKEKAELGLALDGDADRLGAVDATGRIVWGDQLLLLLAQAILKEEPGATFLAEVKCSRAVYDEIEKAGGKAIMWKVGHSLLKEKMKEVGAALAGEMSGHLFFAHRYLGYDDAIYAGARLVELLSQSSQTFSEHIDTLPILYNTPEIRMPVPDKNKFEIVKQVTDRFRKLPGVEVIDIDGARIHFQDAWALVRASNTQAVLVFRFEANTQEKLLAIQNLVKEEMEQIQKNLFL